MPHDGAGAAPNMKAVAAFTRALDRPLAPLPHCISSLRPLQLLSLPPHTSHDTAMAAVSSPHFTSHSQSHAHTLSPLHSSR